MIITLRGKFNFTSEPPWRTTKMLRLNYKHNFQNTLVVTTGFSDFHKMTVTVLKTELS